MLDKKSLILLALFAFASASAEDSDNEHFLGLEGFYAKVSGGYGKMHSNLVSQNAPTEKLHFNYGNYFGLGAGYSVCKSFNIEFMFNFFTKAKYYQALGSGFISSRVSATNPMVNFYYSYDTGTPINPYIILGAGTAHVKWENATDVGSTGAVSKTSFAYAAGVGLSATLSETAFVDFGYKYNVLGKSGQLYTSSAGYMNLKKLQYHMVEISYRYKF